MKKTTLYKKWRFPFIVLVASVLLAALILPSSPALGAPVITLTPASGPTGTTVNIGGTVFSSYEGDSIHIYFDTRELDMSPLVVPGSGEFNVSFNIPAGTSAGKHWIEATTDNTTSSVIAKSAFTVDTTALSLDSAEGICGSSVNISGSGFYVNSTVTLYYFNTDNQSIGTDTASATGTFTHNFIIPIGPAGQHKIYAANTQDNSAGIQYTVLPGIKLNLGSAGPGEPVNVQGSGFAASGAIKILFGTLSVATANADKLGSFEVDFDVPDLKSQSYDVKIQDDKGNSSTISFTVTAAAKLSAASGAVGAELTISGGGFIAGATITITFDDKSLATTAADNNGDFTLTIAVPASNGGKHMISVSDGTSTRELPFSIETQAPPVPALMLPANGSLTRAEANFEWGAVTDASVPVTYDLEVATDQNFATPVIRKTGLTESQYTLSGNETLAVEFKNAPYFWRVRAIDGANNVSEWSTPWVFFVSVPDIPAMQLPADNSAVDYPIRFSWQAVISLSPPVTYDLQIAKDLDFTTVILDKTGLTNPDRLIAKTDNLKLKKGVIYYWRIKAIDDARNSSAWSPAGSFRFSPKSSFPSWAIYTLIFIAAVIAVLIAFRLGRKNAFH
ncbi:MAG: hypothetical protein ABR886_05320 [Dehalococcoidales bacterium]|jgi:hypothetical protein